MAHTVTRNDYVPHISLSAATPYFRAKTEVHENQQHQRNIHPSPFYMYLKFKFSWCAYIFIARYNTYKSPATYPYLDVVVVLAWSYDPESYAGGRGATGSASHARQVKGDAPDKKG